MELFEANTKSSSGISGVLNEYYETVKGIDTTTQDIFGEGNPSKLSMLQKAFLEYSSQTPEDLKMRSVDYTPSPEEIAEAMRQKEEVKAKWTNPDGSMKRGYMLAPNGKPTKLSEDLWLIVRTPNFKRWFGDWETLAEYEFLNGKSIRDISTKSVPSGGFAAIREWAAKIFERQGGVAKNSILGDVILDKASVRDSLAHGGANLYKSAAFEVAKDVIEKGYLIFNDVNKGRDSYYFAAPINIDGVPNIVVALVHKYDNDNRFYLHSVGTKESLLGNRVSGLSKDKSSNTSTTYPRDYLQALQNIFNVKPEDVSKVVDENGEPLVVYHGTDNTNTDYTNFTVFKHSDPRVKKYVHFFSSNRDVAGSMGSYIYDVFLNIKNPLIIDAGGNDWGAIKDHTNGKVKFSDLTNEQKKKLCKVFDCTMKELESSYRADSVIDLVQAGVIKRNERSTNEWAEYARANGYDGVIFKNVRDGAGYDAMSAPADVFASFNSNQVKSAIFDSNNAMSATKSVGTFSNSPDIRWREVEESSDLFERLKNIEGEFVSGGDLKKVDNLKYYFDYFKNNLLGKEIKTPIGKFAYFNLGHFNKLVARGKNKGESEEVSSLNEWIDKIESNGVDLGKNPPKGFDYARACSMPLVIDVLKNPQFILIDTDDTLLFVKKYGEKEYFWCSVMNNGETLGIKSWRQFRLTKAKCENLKIIYTKKDGVVHLAQPRESQRLSALQNNSKNQEKNDIRELERQERGNNPLVWASIVLAKDVLNGRQITQARLEKLLPGYKLDGSKYEYVKDRAQKIAETCRAKYLNAKRDIDQSLQLAESDYYWNSEQMEKIYDSFRKDGEAYGEAKQKIIAYLRAQKDKKLKDVKGYEAEDFKHNLVDSILQAMETEPKPPARESAEGRMLSA